MPVKTVLFIVVFTACSLGALFTPMIGVLGYVGHYCLGERHWWLAPIREWGLRYSFTLALMTAIGIAMHFRKLRYGGSLFVRQEQLILLFLGLIWVSTLLTAPTEGRYTTVDHPSVKMTKVFIFLLMMTHVATTTRDLNRLLWVLVVGAFVLGVEAYATPRSEFASGRLETVGGPDFREANFLGAFLGAMLPIIGIQFLRSGWPGKIACLVSGVFATNAIILTRSRGALVGIAGGALAAVLFAPKKHRGKILIGLAIALAGGLYLTDPGFLHRASTITTEEEEMDSSAESRIEIWSGSIGMLRDHPLGVGVGNFYQEIGPYTNNKYPKADAHSTFVRCYGELGIPGIIVFCLVIGYGGFTLKRVVGEARDLPVAQRDSITFLAYGLGVSLATVLTCGLVISLLYTEALWWLLALPACLERAVANMKKDLGLLPQPEAAQPLAVRRNSSRPSAPRGTAATWKNA